MTVDQKIIGMTTLIKSKSKVYHYTSQGSGFFYSELADEPTGPINEEKQIGWYKVEGEWLITNRHVVFPKISQADGTEKETTPDVFQFYLREVKSGKIEWLPITLNQDQLKERTKLHPNPEVDVVAIKVDDLWTDLITKDSSRHIINPMQLTNRDLPDRFPVKLESTTDVIVCSYPHEFYDVENKFPIIKSGIIASSWNANFNGEPFFLVDAKLFPGSSGGMVLSKPVDIAIINGQLMRSDEKRFCLLGVYSGQFSHQEKDKDGKTVSEPFGLGIVWYSRLISEIIKTGSPIE